MNPGIIKTLVAKDASLYLRNRLFAFLTALGIVTFIIIYFVLPNSVDEELEIAFAPYAGYTISTFENPLVFPDVNSVLGYWESYSLYCPELRTSLEQVLTSHFKEHSTFTTIKRVRGILAHA